MWMSRFEKIECMLFLLHADFWPTTSITSPRFPASAPHPIRIAEQAQEAEMTDTNIGRVLG